MSKTATEATFKLKSIGLINPGYDGLDIRYHTVDVNYLILDYGDFLRTRSDNEETHFELGGEITISVEICAQAKYLYLVSDRYYLPFAMFEI